jgi:hypothetical protein
MHQALQKPQVLPMLLMAILQLLSKCPCSRKLLPNQQPKQHLHLHPEVVAAVAALQMRLPLRLLLDRNVRKLLLKLPRMAQHQNRKRRRLLHQLAAILELLLLWPPHVVSMHQQRNLLQQNLLQVYHHALQWPPNLRN